MFTLTRLSVVGDPGAMTLTEENNQTDFISNEKPNRMIGCHCRRDAEIGRHPLYCFLYFGVAVRNRILDQVR